jgi:VWFA-related protein
MAATHSFRAFPSLKSARISEKSPASSCIRAGTRRAAVIRKVKEVRTSGRSKLAQGLEMRHLRTLLGVAVVLVLIFPQTSTAQARQGLSDTPAIQVNSRLVFLDVTVLDKQGRPVTSGLTKDDFTIMEGKRPQRIFSFEAPQAHTGIDGDNPEGEAPVTIFVLDLLNSSFEDFAFIRDSVRQYLALQPPQLGAPAEMLAVGNQSLELLQAQTRSKEDLLAALDQLPPAIPYKLTSGSFIEERFDQSVFALQQIALANKSVAGRKNIIWVGHGAPSFTTKMLTQPIVHELQQYMHATTNLLVDSRTSLFVIYPGLKVGASARIGKFVTLGGGPPMSIAEADAGVQIDGDNPFADDINFGVFVNETGGKLFYNRNDVEAEIERSKMLGSEYYTLTYQPHGGNEDGKFRQIRVTLRDPNLRAMTKTGYYAPDKNAPSNGRQQTATNLAEAARFTIPLSGLDVTISRIVRHPDTRTVDLTVLLASKGLDWRPIDDGKSTAGITVAVASLTGNQEILASRVENLILRVPTQDPTHLAKLVTTLQLRVRVPPKTQSIRVVTEAPDNGRIGAADLSRRSIDGALSTPTPEPHLAYGSPDGQVSCR